MLCRVPDEELADRIAALDRADLVCIRYAVRLKAMGRVTSNPNL
jgi:hypothetical protein